MATAIVDSIPPSQQQKDGYHLELHGDITPPFSSNLLVASPYTTPPHLLDLTTLSLPCSLLARALQQMSPTTPRYATTPYHEAFNWPAILASLQSLLAISHPDYTFPETSFYVIVFRSQVLVETDRTKLGLLDKDAHIEAVESGGLLKYWFGTPDGDGRNLATCLWRDRGDARRGGAGKGHAKAMREVRGMYKEWRVERLRFVVGEGAKEWRFEEWTE